MRYLRRALLDPFKAPFRYALRTFFRIPLNGFFNQGQFQVGSLQVGTPILGSSKARIRVMGLYEVY